MPGPSMSANMIEKSSSLTPTLIPSGGDSSRFFNSFASCFITFGGRFSLVAWKYDIIKMFVKGIQQCKSEEKYMTCFQHHKLREFFLKEKKKMDEW